MTRLIFHWHSFVEIETNQGSILIDPFITENPKCDISLEDILQKDILMIGVTHWHTDHIWDTVKLAKSSGAKVVCSFELANYFMDTCGLDNVQSMHIWGSYNSDFYSLKLVQAVHWGWIWKEGWNKQKRMQIYPTKASGFVFSLEDYTVYHAWDTALTYDMKLLKDMDIDVAFLPIGDNFTMGVDDAVKACKFIDPNIVVPIHYDTWDVIKVDSTEFAKKVMLENLAKPKVLNPGQLIDLESI